jgi:hypothetical protein
VTLMARISHRGSSEFKCHGNSGRHGYKKPGPHPPALGSCGSLSTELSGHWPRHCRQAAAAGRQRAAGRAAGRRRGGLPPPPAVPGVALD